MTINRNTKLSIIGLYTLAMRKLIFLQEIEKGVINLLPSSPLLNSDDIKSRVGDFLYSSIPNPYDGEEAVEELIRFLTYDEANADLVAQGKPPEAFPRFDMKLHHHVYTEINEECIRNTHKWGEQDHPSICPLPDYPELTKEICRYYAIPTPFYATQNCDNRHKAGEGSWADIAVEELVEAVAAAIDGDEGCRAELVQLGAVIVAWIATIDRRRALWSSNQEGGSDA